MNKPYIIEFPAIGSSEIGYISVAENSDLLPFEVKRVFWTYGTPESIVRGRHAHYQTQQVILAVNGRILVTTEQADGPVEVFVLERPNLGLYVPPNVWHTMQYSNAAVQMVLASTSYSEEDYIRDHSEFRSVWK
ncbi:sugar 3,4-ketoisomerase [Rufibacter tibetensis]|uniref:dTDP-6-deoxy-3,4-keto-hexulose isomerase n=1 Tax=Rufibacter tibetensis TaxID=512763 RepID=A0A0P0CT62_9BACT|nr:FdtA/QdtA family cupin domain-containing protein [Rufibacter tibetensis]ALI99745.1 dTDP-6-deoxy-3,4-keto-hexulose isomerase [Rufibacter tibetensis]